MAIFTNRYSGLEYTINENFVNDETCMYDIFMESLDDDMLVIESMCAMDALEMKYDNAIAEAYDSYDRHRLESEKQAVMENAATDALKRIKDAIVKFFKSVMSWFKGIIDRIRALVMDGETFAKKFGEKVRSATLPSGGLDVKGYEYNLKAIFEDDLQNDIDNGPEAIKQGSIDEIFSAKTEEEIKHIEEKYKEDEYTVNAILAKTLSLSTKADSNRVDEALFNKFYGRGAKSKGKEKITIKSTSTLYNYLTHLEKSTKLIKDLEKYKTVFNNETSNIVKDIDAYAKDATKEDDEFASSRMRVVNKVTSKYKNKNSAYIRIANTRLQAVKSFVMFAKGACLKAVRKTKPV